VIAKQENTPDILLYMPEPGRLVEVMSAIGKEQTSIDLFRKSINHDDIDKIIKDLDSTILILKNQLSADPPTIDCYKVVQQRLSDEYFYIQRTDNDLEKRYVLNAFVIARDLLVDNKIDDYFEKEKVKRVLEVMSNLLSYASERG
jgi:uncharacterized protein YjgD (DUF1641 family)